MELTAQLKYRNGMACFKIYKERADIYFVDLVRFDGDKKFSPPQKIILVKGIRQWTGSYSDLSLLNELGKIIEMSYQI